MKAKKSISILLVVVMLLLSVACGKIRNNDLNQTVIEGSTEKRAEDITAEELTTEEPLRELVLPRTESFDNYDIEINKHVSDYGIDLYEIDYTAWEKYDKHVTALKKYNETDVVILYLSGRLVRLNTATLEVVAQCKLPSKLTWASLFLDNAGNIILQDDIYGYVEIYDGNLNLVKQVNLPNENIISYCSNEDYSIVYCYNNVTSTVYKYDVERNIEEELVFDCLKDIEYARILAVFSDRNQIAFDCYTNGGPKCVIADITKGETINEFDGVGDLSCLGYGIYFSDGIFFRETAVAGDLETTLGKIEEEPSYIVAIDYPTDNFFVHPFVEDYVFTSYMDADIEKTEQIFSLYDLDGNKLKETRVSLGENYGYVTHVVYMEELQAVVFTVGDQTASNGFFVWDLCGENSKVNDDERYVYSISEIENDVEFATEVRAYADEIECKYGVEIGIGNEVNVSSSVYKIERMYDYLKINRTLKKIDAALARYPEGMLEQMQLVDGRPMTIYLCGNIYGMSGDQVNGLHSQAGGTNYIYINCNPYIEIELTFYHEIFHAIEKFLEGNGNGFDSEVWNSYNPDGFTYNNSYSDNEVDYKNEKYLITTELQSEKVKANISFIDEYCMSYPQEDRAIVMECAMMKFENCFQYTNIRSKLEYECEKIREGFDTTGWPEVTEWEKFIQ